MATPIKARGIILPSETVSLGAQFYSTAGEPADLTSFPTVSIISPDGTVIRQPSATGVYRANIGQYFLDQQTTPASQQGVYLDRWVGQLTTGEIVTKEFNFVIFYSQAPGVNPGAYDGYCPIEALGDDVGFHYSQIAIRNINKLLKALKARLRSAGMTKITEPNGTITFHPCDIFSTDTLVTFIAQSITMFNEIPHFTDFTFDHTNIVDRYFNVLVQGATILALSSQALIERGREYQITDSGLSFTPPTLSELLQTEWSTELTNHTERVKQIKASMKPAPMVISSLTGTIFRNPQLQALRYLKERQIF